MRYIDPTGMWEENADGTYTAVEGDTLWGLQKKTGRDWRSFGYEGDPTKLQIGEKVGKADNWSKTTYSMPENLPQQTEKNSTVKTRVYGGLWAASGGVVAAISGANLVALKNKCPESVSDANAKALVLGIQMFLLGTAQAASGKKILPSNPLSFFAPLIYDLYKAFTKTMNNSDFSIENLRS